MLFILLFSFAGCLVEKLTHNKHYSAITYILGEPNTAHFVQTQLKDLTSSSFRTFGDDEAYTRMSVYKGMVESKETMLISDEKSGETNTFFFTTPSRDDYMIVFELVQPEDLEEMQAGLDYKIFSGDANKPAIVSNNDVEVYKAENAIDRVFDFVKKNFIIQEMDEEQEQFYRTLYEEIIRKACYLIVLKIVATGVTLYYTSKKTKSFYAQQGLGGVSK